MKKKIILIAIICVVLAVAIVLPLVLLLKKEPPVYDFPEKDWYAKEFDGAEDTDGDGLTNQQELDLGTNPNSPDTDEDGLNDGVEVNTLKTDPKKADTDNDGLSDYAEIKAGTDPLSSKTDGQDDFSRQFTETIQEGNMTLSLQGNAQIYETYFGQFALPGLSTVPGVMSDIYEFYSLRKIPEATVTFSVNSQDVEKRGGKMENLALFAFLQDGSFERISGSTRSSDNPNQITAHIQAYKKSVKYFLADEELLLEEHKARIMLLIDNSGSMYPAELCEGSDENDVDFKRLDMARAIIEHLPDVQFGLSKFTATYTPMAEMGADKETLSSAIGRIRTEEENFNGTYIAASVISASTAFGEGANKDKKLIILLTDGASTENSGLFSFLNSDVDDAISACVMNNVSVIAIGLGNAVDTDYLQKLSKDTGGAYFYANSAEALETVYETIENILAFSEADWDEDGVNESYVLADSGFSLEDDAFSFPNCVILTENGEELWGLCYGYAAFAQTFYRGTYITSAESTKMDNITIPAFDIRNMLNRVSALRRYSNAVMNSYGAVDQMEKQEKYELDDHALVFKEEIKNEHITSPYLTIRSSSVDQTRWGEEDDYYTSYEYIVVDLQKYLAETQKNADMEMVKALYWYWASQTNNAPGQSIEKWNLTSGIAGYSSVEEFGEILGKISDGVPLILSYYVTTSAGHSINLMRVLRDFDDPSVYYLECYDNNYPNKPVYFKLKATDMDFWSKTSYDNWGSDYCVVPYMREENRWEHIALEFEEVKYQ